MCNKFLLAFIAAVMLFSCKKENPTTDPPPPPLPPSVLIKDVIINNLPSPFYHFEYDVTGRAIFVSYASDLTRYDVIYKEDKISEMRNNTLLNKDRLQYFYDNAGKVNMVKYADSTGLVNTIIDLSYEGQKLIKLERRKKTGADFIPDKTITMIYHPDGNLFYLSVHRPAIGTQSESLIIYRYEQYDNKINAEGFSLLHDEFFDHFVFLPEVQLQKNNPGKETRMGDGNNYVVDYTYTYDGRGAPLAKSGDFVFTNGPYKGQRTLLSSAYTYYP